MAGLRILLLSNNPVSAPLAEWLEANGENVTRVDQPLSPPMLDEAQPDWLVSYTYRHMIRPWVLDRLPGRVVNLHISLLPHNRGADPNLWSFIDGTPKGVTLHEVDAGLDTGRLLAQRELHFDPEQVSLGESYDQLNQAIVSLFCDSWHTLVSGEIEPVVQPAGGSLHRRAELDPHRWILERYGWGITPARFIELMKQGPGTD
jgi:dTDP-4-amino-4,6-dideoxyglucose formyltransferase